MKINNYIACSPLSRYKSENSGIYLTPEYIKLLEGDKITSFHISTVSSISTGARVMLFPVILGGIACPLALISAFRGTGDPWIMLFIGIIGLIGIYVGLSGQTCLIITTNVKEYVYFIDEFHSFIQPFVTLSSIYLSCPHFNHTLFLMVPDNQENFLQINGMLNLARPEPIFFRKPTEEQCSLSKGHWYIIEEPLKHKLTLHVSMEENNKISAKIEGIIPIDGLKKYI